MRKRRLSGLLTEHLRLEPSYGFESNIGVHPSDSLVLLTLHSFRLPTHVVMYSIVACNPSLSGSTVDAKVCLRKSDQVFVRGFAWNLSNYCQNTQFPQNNCVTESSSPLRLSQRILCLGTTRVESAVRRFLNEDAALETEVVMRGTPRSRPYSLLQIYESRGGGTTDTHR